MILRLRLRSLSIFLTSINQVNELDNKESCGLFTICKVQTILDKNEWQTQMSNIGWKCKMCPVLF